MTAVLFVAGGLVAIIANASRETWAWDLPEYAALVTAECIGIGYMLCAIVIEAAR